MTNNKGFSVVELVVALGIIALISIISLPLLLSYQKTTKLRSESRVLAANLRLAQQLAVTEQTIYQVKFFSGTNSYQIINSQTNEIIKTVDLDPEVSINQISGLTDNTAQYNATGGVLEPGYIVLINTKNTISTIQIKPSGYVQIIE